MSRARSIWLVARRELFERGRSRGFIFSVLFTTTIIIGSTRPGRFADQLRQEETSGYPRLGRARVDNRQTLLEETYRRLSGAED